MGTSSALLAIYLIVQWIVISSVLILYNKALISGSFDFPITLVLMHMIFGTCASSLWMRCGFEKLPRISFNTWLCGFLPIGLAFSASLALGNLAYERMSVANIQMIKAGTPIVTLVLSFCFGIEQPSLRLSGYVVLVSVGIAISSATQIEYSAVGTLMMFVVLLCEGLRVTFINLLLTSRGLQFSSMASFTYIAPTSLLCLAAPWAVLEAKHVFADEAIAFRRAGFLALGSNASIAFLLNLATLALIQHTSPLTLNVSGVVKDLLLIAWSVGVNGATVGGWQYFGYALAFAGAMGYTDYKRRLAAAPQATADEERQRLLDDEMDLGEEEASDDGDGWRDGRGRRR